MDNFPTLEVVQGAALVRVLKAVDLAAGSCATACAPCSDGGGSQLPEFDGSEVLAGTVSVGQNLPALISFVAAWCNPSAGQYAIALDNAQTATLSVDGIYLVQVFATKFGTTYCIGMLYLKVLPAAGNQAPAFPPDLISASYATQMLGSMALSPAQLEQIPTAITAASAAVRRHCMDRIFTRMTIAEELPVALNGQVRLSQIPVNQVFRIQTSPSDALTVYNGRAQYAQAYFATAGAVGDVIGNQSITGLTLNWALNGVLGNQTITYAAGMNIAALAQAIDAVGFGWNAVPDPVLGLWPVAELTGGLVAQGCTQGAGATFDVFSQDLATARFHPDDGQKTGIIWCGTQYRGSGPRWGPDYPEFDGPQLINTVVRCTYDSGFATIPYPIQLACVELVKAILERLKIDLYLSSESAGEYSYAIAPALIAFLPVQVVHGLAQYRIHNA